MKAQKTYVKSIRLTGPMAQPIALAAALLDRDALAVARHTTNGDVAEQAIALLKKQARRDAERWVEREYRKLHGRGRVRTALLTVLLATQTAEERAATLVV